MLNPMRSYLIKVLIIYLKRMAWAASRNGDEREGENVKVRKA